MESMNLGQAMTIICFIKYFDYMQDFSHCRCVKLQFQNFMFCKKCHFLTENALKHSLKYIYNILNNKALVYVARATVHMSHLMSCIKCDLWLSLFSNAGLKEWPVIQLNDWFLFDK